MYVCMDAYLFRHVFLVGHGHAEPMQADGSARSRIHAWAVYVIIYKSEKISSVVDVSYLWTNLKAR